ncbi:MAG TPA: Tim44/TimA family putative adaptor protein [Rhodospirillales bacterium]|nr:Tim44/TimA family putative adaptor protein [Rhodospirillales bacterium]
MGNGFQFFDIILFAMIAIFLIRRLRGVLGRRDGHEGGFSDIFSRLSEKDKQEKEEDAENDNVIHLDHQDDAGSDEVSQPEEEVTPLLQGLRTIAAGDRDFDPDEFISGARIAFEYILGAYAGGDAKSLKPLLNADVFANFSMSIREREEAGQTMEETLVGIRKAEIVEAELVESIAQITVKFVSDQVHALSDSDGNVVEGDPNKIVDVTDFWTFSRDTRSRDPNWSLAATRSLD